MQQADLELLLMHAFPGTKISAAILAIAAVLSLPITAVPREGSGGRGLC